MARNVGRKAALSVLIVLLLCLIAIAIATSDSNRPETEEFLDSRNPFLTAAGVSPGTAESLIDEETFRTAVAEEVSRQIAQLDLQPEIEIPEIDTQAIIDEASAQAAASATQAVLSSQLLKDTVSQTAENTVETRSGDIAQSAADSVMDRIEDDFLPELLEEVHAEVVSLVAEELSDTQNAEAIVIDWLFANEDRLTQSIANRIVNSPELAEYISSWVEANALEIGEVSLDAVRKSDPEFYSKLVRQTVNDYRALFAATVDVRSEMEKIYEEDPDFYFEIVKAITDGHPELFSITNNYLQSADGSAESYAAEEKGEEPAVSVGEVFKGEVDPDAMFTSTGPETVSDEEYAKREAQLRQELLERFFSIIED